MCIGWSQESLPKWSQQQVDNKKKTHWPSCMSEKKTPSKVQNKTRLFSHSEAYLFIFRAIVFRFQKKHVQLPPFKPFIKGFLLQQQKKSPRSSAHLFCFFSDCGGPFWVFGAWSRCFGKRNVLVFRRLVGKMVWNRWPKLWGNHLL